MASRVLRPRPDGRLSLDGSGGLVVGAGLRVVE